MRSMFRAVLASALALAGGGALAQVAASDGAFDKFYAQVTGVGKQTINFGSNGQLVVGQGVPQISTAGGPVLVDRSVPVLNNSGSPISANARVAVPPAVLGQIIKKGLALAPVLGAGIALYDLVKELGFDAQKTPEGVTYSQVTTSATYGGFPSVNAYCMSMGYHRGEFVSFSQQSAGTYANITCYWNNNGGSFQTLYKATQTTTPVTEQAFVDAIATQSGWPASSHVSRAVAQATSLSPAPSFPATPQVTGPASSPGTVKSKQNPDGSSEVKTTTHNHTYQGNTINTTTTTVTSTCTGGSCNTTTETETPKLDDQPFAMPCGVAGTPACAVKVDETGVPQTVSELENPKQRVDEQLAPLEQLKTDPSSFWPELPALNWSFALPTGCGPISVPAFAPFLDSIDVCQHQPMFHDIMSLVWTLGGLFGAISTFWRNVFATQ